MLRFSLIILLLLTVPAKAQDSLSRAEIRQQLVSSCKFWENCGQYFKQRSPRHYELHRLRTVEVNYERPRHWKDWRENDWRDFERRRWSKEDRERDGYRSVGTDVEVLSSQRTTKDQALNDAAEKWAAKVQWVHGGQWMDVGESARFRHRCGPTQPGDGAASKAANVGNAIAEYTPGTPQYKARKEGEETGAFRCELIATPCREAREWRDGEDRRRRR